MLVVDPEQHRCHGYTFQHALRILIARFAARRGHPLTVSCRSLKAARGPVGIQDIEAWDPQGKRTQQVCKGAGEGRHCHFFGAERQSHPYLDKC